MPYTLQGPFINNGLPAINATRLNAMDNGIKTANDFVDRESAIRRHLATFAGASDSARFRQACTDVAAMGNNAKVTVVLPPNCTLDAGTTPFSVPTGMHVTCAVMGESEFAHQGAVNIRHTGITGTGAGVFKMASGGSGHQKFSNISFLGTITTRAFQDSPFDTSGDYWRYVTFSGVSFNQFESIYQGPMLGFTWEGLCYLNNFSTTREPMYFTGSDNNIWASGAFMECGAPSGISYSTAATCPAMVRMGSLAKTRWGQIYITGSPTTPFRLDGGEGGIALAEPTIEGRPVPGGGPRFLYCAGELVRLTGGSMTARSKWWGFAMRDPAATGRNPGGFIHITGGDHVIDGGTFQPYTAATYGGTVPPFIYITGGHVRVSNITQGTNTGGVKPIVKYANISMVDADSSVTLVSGAV